MKLQDKIQTVKQIFADMGYMPIVCGDDEGVYNRKGSHQPSDCDNAFIFYPVKSGLLITPTHRMFRAYIHNQRDEVLLRVNHPDYEYGLGKIPYPFLLSDREGICKFLQRTPQLIRKTKGNEKQT